MQIQIQLNPTQYIQSPKPPLHITLHIILQHIQNNTLSNPLELPNLSTYKLTILSTQTPQNSPNLPTQQLTTLSIHKLTAPPPYRARPKIGGKKGMEYSSTYLHTQQLTRSLITLSRRNPLPPKGDIFKRISVNINININSKFHIYTYTYKYMHFLYFISYSHSCIHIRIYIYESPNP